MNKNTEAAKTTNRRGNVKAPVKKSMPIAKMAYVAIGAALVAVLSQISFPLPFTPVPINLAVLGVLIIGGVLGSYWGSLSMAIYIVLGCIGIPVFAGLSSGAGAIIGPTGGYILGYVAVAYIAGMADDLGAKSKVAYVVTLVVAVLTCYALGTAWFMYSTSRGMWESLTLCVFPFVVGDALKIVVAMPVINRLKKAIKL